MPKKGTIICSTLFVFLALYDYSFDCSFPSFISPLLNFSGYCIITLVVSIILCQYQFAQFTIWTLCIVWTLCTCSAIVIAFFIKGYLTWLDLTPDLWPPNSPDLNPVDYCARSILQEKVYGTRFANIDELKCLQTSGMGRTGSRNHCISDQARAYFSV